MSCQVSWAPVQTATLQQGIAAWSRAAFCLVRKAEIVSKRRRRRETDSFEEVVLRLALLLAFLAGPGVFAWFNQRPWAIVLAVAILVSGALGLIAFFLTWRQMKREEQRRRLVTSQNWLNLTPAQFEEYVAELFGAGGYRVQITGGIADGGIDIEVEKDGKRAIVQCKRYHPRNKVGVEEVRAFCSVVHHSKAERGYFVTSSSFTNEAAAWAKKDRVTTIDGKRLIDLMKKVNFGPYAKPMPRPPLFFTAAQWLTLTLLVTSVIGVFGFLFGLVVWG